MLHPRCAVITFKKNPYVSLLTITKPQLAVKSTPSSHALTTWVGSHHFSPQQFFWSGLKGLLRKQAGQANVYYPCQQRIRYNTKNWHPWSFLQKNRRHRFSSRAQKYSVTFCIKNLKPNLLISQIFQTEKDVKYLSVDFTISSHFLNIDFTFAVLC